MYCSNCGNEVPDDAKTCPECGQDLSYESKKTAGLSRSQKKNRHRGKQKSHHGLLVLILVFLAGSVVFRFVKGPSGKVSSSDLVPSGQNNGGGVTNLLAEGDASSDTSSDADSTESSISRFLGGREPTPTITVTPIAQMPETKAKVINTPTPAPQTSAAPSASPTPASAKKPTPGAAAAASPAKAPAASRTPAPSAVPKS